LKPSVLLFPHYSLSFLLSHASLRPP
jgi:hypothetical protein